MAATFITCGAFENQQFFSQVHFSRPVFITVPDVVIGEEAFPLDAVLFFLDLFFLGVGVEPGFSHEPFRFKFAWFYQFE